MSPPTGRDPGGLIGRIQRLATPPITHTPISLEINDGGLKSEGGGGDSKRRGGASINQRVTSQPHAPLSPEPMALTPSWEDHSYIKEVACDASALFLQQQQTPNQQIPVNMWIQIQPSLLLIIGIRIKLPILSYLHGVKSTAKAKGGGPRATLPPRYHGNTNEIHTFRCAPRNLPGN